MSEDDKRSTPSLHLRVFEFVFEFVGRHWKGRGARAGRFNPVAPAIIAMPFAIIASFMFMAGVPPQFGPPEILSHSQRLARLPMKALGLYASMFALVYLIRMWRYRIEEETEASPPITPPDRWPDPRE